jgi:hypothetical protein
MKLRGKQDWLSRAADLIAEYEEATPEPRPPGPQI